MNTHAHKRTCTLAYEEKSFVLVISCTDSWVDYIAVRICLDIKRNLMSFLFCNAFVCWWDTSTMVRDRVWLAVLCHTLSLRNDCHSNRTWKLQYIPRNTHTVFALLCFVVVIHWLIFPYPSGLLHWHCGNLTIAPVPAKQPWWIWINTSCEFIMNDCITTTKQSTTKPYAYFLGYTVCCSISSW